MKFLNPIVEQQLIELFLSRSARKRGLSQEDSIVEKIDDLNIGRAIYHTILTLKLET